MKKSTELKIAVVLCGSGFKDGSEIRESVAVLWALSQHPVQVQCFAPDAPQHDVVNCLTGSVTAGESRNMLTEAARIARGKILPLAQLDANHYDGIIFPGGFGAAKNLCTFAFQGSAGSVRPDVQLVIDTFYHQGKAIGAVCIAPALIALALKGKGLLLTLGETCEASQEIEKLGHEHEVCSVDHCVTDEKHRVVSTPAYMYDDAALHGIFEGIRKLVTEVVRIAKFHRD